MAFYVAVYVDDLLMATKDLEVMKEVKKGLSESFDMKDLGEAHQFLGMVITRNRREKTIHLSQQSLLEKILVDADMVDCNATSSPFEITSKLRKDIHERTATEQSEIDDFDFRHTVGQLFYVSNNTRPDLAAAVGIVSSYVNNPGLSHIAAVKRILRYVKGTVELGLVLGGRGRDLEGFSDADWAGDLDTRRSRTGYAFYIGTGCVSWMSKKQATVALSTTEAEYQSLSAATAELIWIRSLLAELKRPQIAPTTVFQDNTGCVQLSQNSKGQSRVKHMDIRHHFLRDAVTNKVMNVEWLSTHEMVADIMTKPLPAPTFLKLRDLLNLETRSKFLSVVEESHLSKEAVNIAHLMFF